MAKILKIEKIKVSKNNNSKRINAPFIYDIEVEGNYNYFANNLLVSNSGCDTIYDLNVDKFQNIYHRYGFTATNYRNDESDMSLKGVLSDTLYSYKYTQATEEGYLTPVNFLIYENENENAQGKYLDEVTEAIVKNTIYNDHIATLATSLDKKGISTIIFVSRIEHGEILKDLIPNSVFINGEKPSAKKRKENKHIIRDFNDKKFNILIGTNVIGEGVDTVPATVGILASGTKAESDVVQKIGRLMRLHDKKQSSVFIDFTNKGTKFLNKHYNLRLKIYESYNSKIQHKVAFNS